MSETAAALAVISSIALGALAGICLPVRSFMGDRLSLLRAIGFSVIPAVVACILAKSIMDSAASGTAVFSRRLGMAYELAASPIGFYFTNAFKLLLVFLLAMAPFWILRVHRSQI